MSALGVSFRIYNKRLPDQNLPRFASPSCGKIGWLNDGRLIK